MYDTCSYSTLHCLPCCHATLSPITMLLLASHQAAVGNQQLHQGCNDGWQPSCLSLLVAAGRRVYLELRCLMEAALLPLLLVCWGSTNLLGWTYEEHCTAGHETAHRGCQVSTESGSMKGAVWHIQHAGLANGTWRLDQG